ncbi:MAG: SRPBCC family protein [Bacteroidota bacterium]
MKKTMLTLLFSLLALLALAVAFGFHRSAPLRNITLDNSVTIDGESSEVFAMVQYLENFPRWSPFLAEDPGQEYEVRGVDGTVGATYHWNGRGGKDIGYQKIVRIEPGEYLEMRCDIQKPFVAHPTFAYSFKNTPQGVRVSQRFTLESGAVDALFMWLFGAKAEMDATNKRGMELLKAAVESAPAASMIR